MIFIADGVNERKGESMADIQMVIDALQDAEADEFNCIKITDEARCAMVRILMKYKDESEKTIESLEDDLATTKDMLNHYLNGNE